MESVFDVFFRNIFPLIRRSGILLMLGAGLFLSDAPLPRFTLLAVGAVLFVLGVLGQGDPPATIGRKPSRGMVLRRTVGAIAGFIVCLVYVLQVFGHWPPQMILRAPDSVAATAIALFAGYYCITRWTWLQSQS